MRLGRFPPRAIPPKREFPTLAVSWTHLLHSIEESIVQIPGLFLARVLRISRMSLAFHFPTWSPHGGLVAISYWGRGGAGLVALQSRRAGCSARAVFRAISPSVVGGCIRGVGVLRSAHHRARTRGAFRPAHRRVGQRRTW